MKLSSAPALVLCALALVLLPFTILIKTSANGPLREGKKRSSSGHSIAAPANFTVMNNLDEGAGSLRDAINQANLNPGPDTIDFDSSVTSINVGSTSTLPLPNITEALTIDGGASRVELFGINAGKGANGLTIQASGVTLRGFVINSFQGDGISISASNCVIQNNFIGTDIAGDMQAPNFLGISINGTNNLIGGTSPGDANVISGNTTFGIELDIASSNTIRGNFIGTNASGIALPNGQSGIRTIGSPSNNVIGGTVAGAGNIIKFNTGSGVNVFGGSNNSILGNSIFGNGGIGINLSDDPGVTANDMCDLDTGANELQNFPMLTSATSAGGVTNIVGILDSTMNTSFRVEFFSSPSCDTSDNGQGETFIGAATINTPVASCVANINLNLAVSVPVGSVITATATDPANNTSEFSACVTVAAGQVSDLSITNSDSPDPVLTGSNITYSIGVTNNGPDPDIGVTFTDTIPAGTTFVSLTSPGSCSTPPVGGTGIVSCSLGPLNPAASASITLVVNVNASPGSTIINTPTVSGMSGDSNLLNNSATASTLVIGSGCSLTCPRDLLATTTSSDSSCGTVVTYSAVSGCPPVTCSPPSGSVFPVGSTIVNCSDSEGSSCSFNILVVDEVPPRINCTTGVAVPLPAGSSSAVVNYPAPTATDECGSVNISCNPPSGSTFPPGATLVTCSAIDASQNQTRCTFFVSVLDAQPPVISCPGNISVSPPAGQSSAVITYPPPTATDNLPGVTTACTPASGSTFPVGLTTVTCTATDSGGNRASCSFTVGVGGPQVSIIIPGNKPTVDFNAAPARKVKLKNAPCSSFTIENVGFSPLVLTLDSIARTGSAVDSGRITDTNDTRYFSLNLINADQSLTPLDIGGVVNIPARQSRNICVKFAALIPALAGKTTTLAASNVLPDTVTSRVVFRQNAGANIAVPLSAKVSTALVFVNISNPRAVPEVLFARSGDDITVSYAVFDSNLDVTRARYEFLNGSGQVVAGPFEIDLTSSINSANLLKGQSFIVEQRFTGGNSNPEAISVRVTVFDGESSDTNQSTASANITSAASVQLMNRARRVTLYPPTVALRR